MSLDDWFVGKLFEDDEETMQNPKIMDNIAVGKKSINYLFARADHARYPLAILWQTRSSSIYPQFQPEKVVNNQVNMWIHK